MKRSLSSRQLLLPKRKNLRPKVKLKQKTQRKRSLRQNQLSKSTKSRLERSLRAQPSNSTSKPMLYLLIRARNSSILSYSYISMIENSLTTKKPKMTLSHTLTI